MVASSLFFYSSLWLQYESSPLGSCVQTFGPLLMSLFREVVEMLGHEGRLKEAGSLGEGLEVYSWSFFPPAYLLASQCDQLLHTLALSWSCPPPCLPCHHAFPATNVFPIIIDCSSLNCEIKEIFSFLHGFHPVLPVQQQEEGLH